MTSLDIINNRLYALEHKDFGNLGVIEISKKELNQIKQDLEVLEIIKYLTKHGFDINSLDDKQSKKLIDFLNKVGDIHD